MGVSGIEVGVGVGVGRIGVGWECVKSGWSGSV